MTFLEKSNAPRSWLALAAALFVASAAIRLAASAAGQTQPAPAPTPTPQQVEFFETNIRPVLLDTCGECHGPDADGGLNLQSREAMLQGGDSGAAIVPGDPDKSLLLHAIRRDE